MYFSTILYKGDKLCGFLFCLPIRHFPSVTRCTLQEIRLPQVANRATGILKVDSIGQGKQKLSDRVASLTRVLIPPKCIPAFLYCQYVFFMFINK